MEEGTAQAGAAGATATEGVGAVGAMGWEGGEGAAAASGLVAVDGETAGAAAFATTEAGVAEAVEQATRRPHRCTDRTACSALGWRPR